MPASTSRTPSRTLAGVSRLMRPSSSSSPQSPQVEPGGRCTHRCAISPAPSGRPSLLTMVPALKCTDRLVYPANVLRVSAQERFTSVRGPGSGREVAPVAQRDLVVSADGHVLEPIDLFLTRLPKH